MHQQSSVRAEAEENSDVAAHCNQMLSDCDSMLKWTAYSELGSLWEQHRTTFTQPLLTYSSQLLLFDPHSCVLAAMSHYS